MWPSQKTIRTGAVHGIVRNLPRESSIKTVGLFMGVIRTTEIREPREAYTGYWEDDVAGSAIGSRGRRCGYCGGNRAALPTCGEHGHIASAMDEGDVEAKGRSYGDVMRFMAVWDTRVLISDRV